MRRAPPAASRAVPRARRGRVYELLVAEPGRGPPRRRRRPVVGRLPRELALHRHGAVVHPAVRAQSPRARCATCGRSRSRSSSTWCGRSSCSRVGELVGARGRFRRAQGRRFRPFLLVAVCVVLGVASFVPHGRLFQSGDDPTACTTAPTRARSSSSSARSLGVLSAGVPTVTRRHPTGVAGRRGRLGARRAGRRDVDAVDRLALPLRGRLRPHRCRDGARARSPRRSRAQPVGVVVPLAAARRPRAHLLRRVPVALADRPVGHGPTTPPSTASPCSSCAPCSRWRPRWPATPSSRCRSGAACCRGSGARSPGPSMPVVSVAAVVASLVVPAVSFPSVRSIPTRVAASARARPTSPRGTPARRGATATRPSTPIVEGRRLLVQLERELDRGRGHATAWARSSGRAARSWRA